MTPWLVWIAAFVFCGTAAAADLGVHSAPGHSDIKIAVYDQAHLPSAVIETAGAEVKRIFGRGGISIYWINCSAHSGLHESCDTDPDNQRFLILRILPDGRASEDLVFGQAFLGANGFGRYADVYMNQVQRLQSAYGFNLSRLLGAIAAHELGHLLLGPHAHAVGGIMTPIWEDYQLRQVQMGGLMFLPQEVVQIEKRIEVLKLHEPIALANFREAK